LRPEFKGKRENAVVVYHAPTQWSALLPADQIASFRRFCLGAKKMAATLEPGAGNTLRCKLLPRGTSTDVQ
jgi:hypothetical protein